MGGKGGGGGGGGSLIWDARRKFLKNTLKGSRISFYEMYFYP